MKNLLVIAILFSSISVEASLITPDSPWGATIFGPAEGQVGEILDSAEAAGFSWIRMNSVPLGGWHTLTLKQLIERITPYIDSVAASDLNLVATWVPYDQPTNAHRMEWFKCMVEVLDGDGVGYPGDSACGFDSIPEIAATVGRPVQYWKIMTESNVCGGVTQGDPYKPVYKLTDYGIKDPYSAPASLWDTCLADGAQTIGGSPIGEPWFSVFWNWDRLYQQALYDLAHYIETSANAIHDAYADAKVIAPSFHMDDLTFWIWAVDKCGNYGKVGFFYYPDSTRWPREGEPLTDEHRCKYWHRLLRANTDNDDKMLGEEIDVIGAHYGSVSEWRITKRVCDQWYNSAGITPKPFWVMETGGDAFFDEQEQFVGELEQAEYYRDKFIRWLNAADAGEFNPKEDKVFIFPLWHYHAPNPTGLLNRNMTPKIAYYTMRDFTYGSVDYYTDLDTTLTKPSIDSLVAQTPNIIEMFWKDCSADNTHFQIYWDDFITVNETGGQSGDHERHRMGSCTAGDLPLPSGTEIGFKMRAFRDDGQIYVSKWTAWKGCTTFPGIDILWAGMDLFSPLKMNVCWSNLSLSVPDIATVELEWMIRDRWPPLEPEAFSPDGSADIADHSQTGYTLDVEARKWYIFRLLVVSQYGDSVYSDQSVVYTSRYGWSSGHHASGTFEVPWRYDPVTTGPFDLHDLIAEAVDGSEGWNGVGAGIKFTETGDATYTWKWGDLDHPAEWARTVVVPFDPIDTLRIGSIETTLNRNIQAGDSTPLYWYNKNTATDSISSNEVDAYSVIMHEWGHWYVLSDASKMTDTSLVTFPHHVAGRIKRDLTASDVSDARWMYSDTAAVQDTTAPNYNGDWVENPGGSLITETAPQTGFFDWMSWNKWSTLYTSTSELASLGRRIHDEMAIDGSIVKLLSDHKKELLCWSVVHPGLFTDALGIVTKYKESLLPVVQDPIIQLKDVGLVVTPDDADEILAVLNDVKNLPFTGLTGLKDDATQAIALVEAYANSDKKIGELLSISATTTFCPGLISPDSGDTVKGLAVPLDWTDVFGESMMYTIRWGTDPTFSNYMQTDSITESEHVLDCDTLSVSATVYWKVKSRDTQGRECWSDVSHFEWSLPTAYWVATWGDDSWPGSKSQPWRHVQKAASELQGYERAIIRCGTYDEQPILTNSGTLGNRIYFSSYAGDQDPVIIGGQDANMYGFQFRGASYISVLGLRFTNHSIAAIDMRSASGVPTSHCLVKDCEIITPNCLDCIHIAGDADCPVVSNQLEDCFVDGSGEAFHVVKTNHAPGTRLIGCTIAGGSYGVRIGESCDSTHIEANSLSELSSFGIFSMLGNSGITIRKNTFHKAGGTGIFLQNDPFCEVSGNSFDSTGSTAAIQLDTGCDSSSVDSNTITLGQGHANLGIRLRTDNSFVDICDNTIVREGDYSSQAGIYLDRDNSNISIERNRILSAGYCGIVIGGASGGNTEITVSRCNISCRDICLNIPKRNQDHIHVYNNFLHSAEMGVRNYGASHSGFYFNSIACCTCYFQDDWGTTDFDTLRNNIMYSQGGYCLFVKFTFSPPDGFSSSSNCLYAPGSHVAYWKRYNKSTLADFQSASGGDLNSISVDPLFVSLSPTDLHILETSMCIDSDAGVAIPGIVTDYDGQARDTLPDLGADEYYAQGSGGGCMAGDVVPLIFKLSQPYPNPLRGKTTISYSIPKMGKVTLKVYDVTGRMVKELVNREQKPGVYTARWEGRSSNGRKLATGVYFVRLCARQTEDGQTRDKTVTKKFVLMR